MPLYDVSIDYFESAQSTRGRYTFSGRVAAPGPGLARDRLLGEFESLRSLSDGAWMAEVLDVTVERRETAEDESFEEVARRFRRVKSWDPGHLTDEVEVTRTPHLVELCTGGMGGLSRAERQRVLDEVKQRMARGIKGLSGVGENSAVAQLALFD